MTDDSELCRATLARGREAYRAWPGSVAEVSSGRMALNQLAGAVLFGDVTLAFTAALVEFARGLHAIAVAHDRPSRAAVPALAGEEGATDRVAD